MAKEDNKLSFDKIMADLKAGRYAPIYFLMGDEPYFIDKISDYIEQNAVAEDERDMNQTVMYGKDVKIEDVIIEARRYPFMAERRVVIVKEAQNLKRNIDKLELYLKVPVQTTTLVFCYKYEICQRDRTPRRPFPLRHHIRRQNTRVDSSLLQ